MAKQKFDLFNNAVFLVFPLIAIGVEKMVKNATISNASLWLILPLLIGILLTLYSNKAASLKKSQLIKPRL
ncbi:hypothetical protein [Serratia symbiotica]|uniref:hypothetical protein n=1 Tax=Serratia symbiotica TaxID=138074 RepID=UPI0030CCC381